LLPAGGDLLAQRILTSLGDALAKGMIDIAVVEEPSGPTQGEGLLIERLVWVGARLGSAHRRHPVPISLVAETCVFRATVLAALHEQSRSWKAVFENGNLETTMAAVRADLAVTASLASMVPPDLDVLPPTAGLPALPPFAINLHLPRTGAQAAATELARHIRLAMLTRPATTSTIPVQLDQVTQAFRNAA
jgi:DNA-binding transcriptional LysR family regulator